MTHPKEFAEGLSIGIIMDGNGRWAKQRGLPRTAGHKKGAAVFQDIANYCEELGVSSVTFYAFSTENWKRPLEEVSAIMKLFGEYLLKGFNYKDRNIRIKFLGDRAALDPKLQKLMNELEEDSAHKTGMTLNIAVNYGGRPEIVRAARQLAEKVKAGDYQVSVSSIGYKTSVVSVLGLSQPIDLGTISLASSSISLDEVTVNASAIRNTADRKIAFPTSEQKAASSNGINLLNALMLPRLEVDPIRNSVSLSNEGTIQFCINGIKVELSDIRGLSPQEVIRIEYHDNPGLRYGNASVVLDYIVRRETSGGSVNLDLSNSPTTSFGDDQVSVKFNHKKSEFGLQYAVRYRNPYHIWTEGVETFRFESGETLERTSEGLPRGMSETAHNLSLNYNLVDNDHYYFNATLRYFLSDEDKGSDKNLYTNNHPEDKTYAWNPNSNSTKRPSLDLYYQHSLPHKQTLILNMVGTYIHTNANQMYQEWKNDILWLASAVMQIPHHRWSE